MKQPFNTCFSYLLIKKSHYFKSFIPIFAAKSEDRLRLGNTKKNEFSFDIALALRYLCSKRTESMINFTELYDQTIDSLFAFGARFTTDREMIKDCIQDVFVKLYTKRGELDSVSNIESYLYVSLKNRINDEFRRNSHISENEIDDSVKTLYDNSDVYDMERIEEEQKKQNTLTEYVKCLSPRQQQIINLYYLEQRKYDDICQIMGINYQSVRNLMHRSLSRLRYIAGQTSAAV